MRTLYDDAHSHLLMDEFQHALRIIQNNWKTFRLKEVCMLINTAAQKGSLSIVVALLDILKKTNPDNYLGINPAGIYAINRHDKEMLKALLSYPKLSHDSGLVNLLSSAVTEGSVEMFKLLLTDKWLLEQTDAFRNALLQAVQKSQEDIVELLISEQLLVKQSNNSLELAFLAAAENDQRIILELFLNNDKIFTRIGRETLCRSLKYYSHSNNINSIALLITNDEVLERLGSDLLGNIVVELCCSHDPETNTIINHLLAEINHLLADNRVIGFLSGHSLDKIIYALADRVNKQYAFDHVKAIINNERLGCKLSVNSFNHLLLNVVRLNNLELFTNILDRFYAKLNAESLNEALQIAIVAYNVRFVAKLINAGNFSLDKIGAGIISATKAGADECLIELMICSQVIAAPAAPEILARMRFALKIAKERQSKTSYCPSEEEKHTRSKNLRIISTLKDYLHQHDPEYTNHYTFCGFDLFVAKSNAGRNLPTAVPFEMAERSEQNSATAQLLGAGTFVNSSNVDNTSDIIGATSGIDSSEFKAKSNAEPMYPGIAANLGRAVVPN